MKISWIFIKIFQYFYNVIHLSKKNLITLLELMKLIFVVKIEQSVMEKGIQDRSVKTKKSVLDMLE